MNRKTIRTDKEGSYNNKEGDRMPSYKNMSHYAQKIYKRLFLNRGSSEGERW